VEPLDRGASAIEGTGDQYSYAGPRQTQWKDVIDQNIEYLKMALLAPLEIS
jgi:hypothetical protein